MAVYAEPIRRSSQFTPSLLKCTAVSVTVYVVVRLFGMRRAGSYFDFARFSVHVPVSGDTGWDGILGCIRVNLIRVSVSGSPGADRVVSHSVSPSHLTSSATGGFLDMTAGSLASMRKRISV